MHDTRDRFSKPKPSLCDFLLKERVHDLTLLAGTVCHSRQTVAICCNCSSSFFLVPSARCISPPASLMFSLALSNPERSLAEKNGLCRICRGWAETLTYRTAGKCTEPTNLTSAISTELNFSSFALSSILSIAPRNSFRSLRAKMLPNLSSAAEERPSCFVDFSVQCAYVGTRYHLWAWTQGSLVKARSVGNNAFFLIRIFPLLNS